MFGSSNVSKSSTTSPSPSIPLHSLLFHLGHHRSVPFLLLQVEVLPDEGLDLPDVLLCGPRALQPPPQGALHQARRQATVLQASLGWKVTRVDMK